METRVSTVKVLTVPILRAPVLMVLLGLLPIVPTVAAAESESPLPGYEVVQFIASGALTPQQAMSFDNNGDVLLACRDGCTPEELEQEGLAVNQSQLEFLRLMRLLRRDGSESWHTAFPVLGAESSKQLDDAALELARAALEAVRPEVDALRRELENAELGASGYSMFFSYVLDGMVWGFFQEYRLVPVRARSVARPFWAGEIWALEVSGADRLGTSSVADGGISLRFLSNRRLGRLTEPLIAQRSAVKQGLRDYVREGRVVDEEARSVLGSTGLVDAEGRFLVPVIDEIGRDARFLAAEKLTEKLVEWMLAEIDFEKQRQALGLRDQSQALLLVYHELMGRFMALLEAEGIVVRPQPLDAAAKDAAAEGGATDLSRLAVVVDRASRRTADQDEQTSAEAGSPQDDGPEEISSQPASDTGTEGRQ